MKKIISNISLLGFITTNSFAMEGEGDIFRSSLVVDKLEYQFSDEKATNWDVYGYAGYDINKIYIYSEGEKVKMNLQIVKPISLFKSNFSFWDAQIGIGYDKIMKLIKLGVL